MAELDATLDGIEAVFLDLDGTMYLGETLVAGALDKALGEASTTTLVESAPATGVVAGALDFLGRVESRGIHRFFLSNNSSRSVSQYLSKLRGLGIPAEADEVLLSTHDLLSWLSSEGVTETYLVGTEGMRGMLEDSGVTTNSDAPQYVVLGYDTEITYEKLAKATIHLHNGVPMVASHPDTVCPSPDGGLPDSGAYMDLFEAATGVRPSSHLWQTKSKDDSPQGRGPRPAS